ncbi:MAG TPA: sigma-70 family RNA polymerase sigma factor [Alphaproteobacteria bacterium]|nr:sigma-70 family RNA polymerase sigma factor [Alphaproteobacteria bacterium]
MTNQEPPDLISFSGPSPHAEGNMNVHASYKTGKTPELEQELQQQWRKLQRRLQIFKPELVHLYMTLESQNGRSFATSLQLRLPSGQIAARATGAKGVAVVRAAFSDLTTQVNRHKDMLRRRFSRKSRRGMPREEPLEASEAIVSSSNHIEAQAPAAEEFVNSWISANLESLNRFVESELRARIADGQIREDQIAREEVVDEVMVMALSPDESRPELLPLESWLNRLAVRAIRRLVGSTADTASVSLDTSARSQNVTGNDEDFLQYHQPDEAWPEEGAIADGNVSTPEEIFATEEMAAQLDVALKALSAEEREAFVLSALEGFTLDEIARLTGRQPEQVSVLVKHAREKVQHALPFGHELKKKLLDHVA